MDVRGNDDDIPGQQIQHNLGQDECEEHCMNKPLATACEHVNRECIVHTYSIAKELNPNDRENRGVCSLILPKGLLNIS